MKRGEKITLGVLVIVFTYFVTYFYISGYQKKGDLAGCIQEERQNYPSAADEDLEELCGLKSRLKGFLGDQFDEVMENIEIEQNIAGSEVQIEGHESAGTVLGGEVELVGGETLEF